MTLDTVIMDMTLRGHLICWPILIATIILIDKFLDS